MYNQFETGQRLKEVRKKIGKTLKQMSEISAISISTIGEIENGRNKPNSRYLFLLADQFHVNLNWVFTGEGAVFLPDFEIKFDFGRDAKHVMELVYLIENCPSIRHDMLAHYLEYKESKKEIIADYLPNDDE